MVPTSWDEPRTTPAAPTPPARPTQRRRRPMLSGNLELFALADVLRFVARSGATGAVNVYRPAGDTALAARMADRGRRGRPALDPRPLPRARHLRFRDRDGPPRHVEREPSRAEWNRRGPVRRTRARDRRRGRSDIRRVRFRL